MSVEKKVPEIRFKGFSGEWENNPIGEICGATFGGGTPSTSEKKFWQGDIPWIQSSDLKDGSVSSVTAKKYITKTAVNKSTTKLVSGNSIAIVTRVGVGKLSLMKGQYATSQDFLSLSDLKVDALYSTYVLWKQLQIEKEQVQGTSIKGITKDELLSKTINYPKIETEQTAIGNYFQQLDSLINQHQQKHDKLSNIKKAMLEKMFPKPGATVPEIRFKGFSGKWEELPFGVCFINVPSNTLSRADLNYQAGLAKNIHYGDVLIKFGEVLDAHNELLPFITNNDVANKLNHAALRNGDIIIADAAEDKTVGKCTELFNIDEQLILSGLHTIAVRPTLSFASKYLGYYLNSSTYHNQLLSLMQGTKVLSISKTAIQNTNVTFPKSSEEQTAIGNYFQKLDALINQHQQQISKLNTIKQACLSKMFV